MFKIWKKEHPSDSQKEDTEQEKSSRLPPAPNYQTKPLDISSLEYPIGLYHDSFDKMVNTNTTNNNN